jgi:hypothetical protein
MKTEHLIKLGIFIAILELIGSGLEFWIFSQLYPKGISWWFISLGIFLIGCAIFISYRVLVLRQNIKGVND